MEEDKGIVPARRVYSILGLGDREMLGPYDIDFERQEKLEKLVEGRDEAVEAEDGSIARQVTHDMLDLIFAEPFTDAEFKKLVPLRVAEWIADFFGDFEKSSEEAAGRATTLVNRAQRRAKSARNSKSTTTPATR